MSDDCSIYQRQGFGSSLGWGERSALIVVDFVAGFNDPAVLGGGNIAPAIEATERLLARAREAGLPVAFTRIVYQPGQGGVFSTKIPALRDLTEDNPMSAIVPSLAVRDGDLVVRKTQASAFFGTDLQGWLTERRIDTLLIAGCTTSGCVRATVVDAASANFRPLVVAECVGDRALGPHEASLFDIQQKYGDVVGLDQVMARLAHQSFPEVRSAR